MSEHLVKLQIFTNASFKGFDAVLDQSLAPSVPSLKAFPLGLGKARACGSIKWEFRSTPKFIKPKHLLLN
ncbi:hypothetical protein TNIN_354731 [Trichonephila inaurata madagascariensis]|uniref:Uncharacterized protein n=1 Tax=Trichonephila inaurata madagascariensis TaxID=2747483 RepID=A0A8X7CIW8_9ARAC|nr:hypothetical protein TNIN_354731 [Trichonephila inaurata madagascariensis]